MILTSSIHDPTLGRACMCYSNQTAQWHLRHGRYSPLPPFKRPSSPHTQTHTRTRKRKRTRTHAHAHAYTRTLQHTLSRAHTHATTKNERAHLAFDLLWSSSLAEEFLAIDLFCDLSLRPDYDRSKTVWLFNESDIQTNPSFGSNLPST